MLKKERFSDFTRVILSDGNDRVAIIPEYGGVVHELVLDGKKIIQGERTAKRLLTSPWYRGAKLLPFPNRIIKGRYSFNGTHQLPLNFTAEGNAIHGLLYNKSMSVVRATGTVLELSYHMEGLQGYPFSLSITVQYALDKRGFSCSTAVKNIGKESAPLGDGWHPYFSLGTVDSLTLSSLGPIGKRTFDTCFPFDGRAVQLSSKSISVELWQEGYKYLQVFTPPDRRCIALEPMTCPPNAFNTKKDLIVLKPKQSWHGRYGVRVFRNTRKAQ